MKRWMAAGIAVLILAGCTRYEPVEQLPETGEQIQATETARGKEQEEAQTEEMGEAIQLPSAKPPQKTRVKVKGIYVSAYVAGTAERMDEIIREIDRTELNAVVIDVKDDNGRITFAMDSPVVNEIGAGKAYISDLPGLMKQLQEHHIYPIARVVAFRDPYLAEKKPEWSLRRADGSLCRDSQGLAWVNPYRREVWDYLVEIGKQAGAAGFKEIQFDYVRFAVDSSMKDAVFDPADTQGRTKTQAVSQFIDYAYDQLSSQGLAVSADVFGTIIKSQEDAQAVGQDYVEMAETLDAVCPMIYPSHYGEGNFGIPYPDTQPYDTVFQALQGSAAAVGTPGQAGEGKAAVRPWLQDFTASYLSHHIEYGDQEIRAQIQAVYDAGYEEWLLWDAGVSYHYGGLLPEESLADQETETGSQG